MDEMQTPKPPFPFDKASIACLLYTICFTFCLYRNIGGITMPIFVAATIGFVSYFIQLKGYTLKRDSIFVIVVMMLIGISSVFTGNSYTHVRNIIAEFLLLVSLLLHNFAEDDKWDVGKYCTEILNACFGAIGCLFKPFSEGNAYLKEHRKQKDGKAQYVILGIVIAIPCVLILGLLLGSADRVFEHFMVSILSALTITENIFGITCMLLFGFFAAYCGLHYIVEHAALIRVKEHQKGEPILAITIMGIISILYLIFSVIQIVYLFVGNMELPEGMTYAQYARSGFFQLLFVCVLNLGLVLSMKKYFRKSKVLDIILLIISGCTYIMTASSALRMMMYVNTYQLTYLRVSVLVALFAIAILLVGVILVIVNPRFRFFRFAVVVVSIIYVGFAFSHVDYFIADYNLSRIEKNVDSFGGSVADYQYISNLSTDAAPILIDYAMNYGDTGWFKRYYFNNKEEMNEVTLRNFNVSHMVAKVKMKNTKLDDEYEYRN